MSHRPESKGMNQITVPTESPGPLKISWIGSLPFLSVHAGSLLVFISGFSWPALVACLSSLVVRMFGITGGYHRYFSHRTYKTSRVFQFILALIGTSAAQMGPLWWAAHHRHHHRHSDTETDIHPPGIRGFWWSHMGWIMCSVYSTTNYRAVRDWMRFPELKWLNDNHAIPPILLALMLAGLGLLLDYFGMETSWHQMLVWGFFLSTVLLYHLTFSINSLTHVIGKRRYETGDDSRNNFLLALVTMGEGWHNNHHHYPASERQGFYWWEIDLTHYILRFLSWVHVVWDLREPPKAILDRKR